MADDGFIAPNYYIINCRKPGQQRYIRLCKKGPDISGPFDTVPDLWTASHSILKNHYLPTLVAVPDELDVVAMDMPLIESFHPVLHQAFLVMLGTGDYVEAPNLPWYSFILKTIDNTVTTMAWCAMMNHPMDANSPSGSNSQKRYVEYKRNVDTVIEAWKDDNDKYLPGNKGCPAFSCDNPGDFYNAVIEAMDFVVDELASIVPDKRDYVPLSDFSGNTMQDSSDHSRSDEEN